MPFGSSSQPHYKEADITNILDADTCLNLLPAGLKLFLLELKQKSNKNLRRALHPPDRKLQLITKIILNANRNRIGTYKMKNISCLETLSVREISQLSEIDLHDLSFKISETADWIKNLKEKFELALSVKYENDAKNKLKEMNKDFGSTSLTKGEFCISVEMPKKVQWDQKILANIYEKMDHEMRDQIFKVTYTISEKEYANLTTTIIEALEPARTTSYGKTKITINKEEK